MRWVRRYVTREGRLERRNLLRLRRYMELDAVELAHPIDKFGVGSRGTVVSAWPEVDDYTVEIFDPAGHTIGLVAAHESDLRPRAAHRHASHSIVVVARRTLKDVFGSRVRRLTR